MNIYYKDKKVKCVEKQIGWDILHFEDGTYQVVKVPVPKGYKRQRAVV